MKQKLKIKFSNMRQQNYLMKIKIQLKKLKKNNRLYLMN